MTGIQRKTMHGQIQRITMANYDSSCMVTLLVLQDLENFRHLSFVVQCTGMDRIRHDHICCIQ
jgi:hypothetical protein